MRYTFIAVYEIMGVSRPQGSEEQLLVDYPSDDARAVIYPDMDRHLFEHDRALVIGNMMLGVLFGKGNDGTFEERLSHELADLQQKRREEAKERLFVLFEATSEIESFNPQSQRERPEFVIALGGGPKDAIEERYRKHINGLLASIAIESENVTGVKKIRDGVVFANDKGKPVYAYDMKMSGTLTIRIPLEDNVLKDVRDNAKLLARHQDLVNPARLLTRSLSETNDALLSFLSVWSGLEIFINRSFRAYEDLLFERLRGGDKPMIPSKFAERIREVMKDKYRLSDKFGLLSLELGGDTALADAADFRRVKDVRDCLIHGEDISLDTLPTMDARRLLRKYLKLHIERPKA